MYCLWEVLKKCNGLPSIFEMEITKNMIPSNSDEVSELIKVLKSQLGPLDQAFQCQLDKSEVSFYLPKKVLPFLIDLLDTLGSGRI